MGRKAQIEATAAATLAAMADAGISDSADVHFVQVKCPLLTAAKVQAALARGMEPATHDAYESMGFSRGASALGVAVALGEVPAAAATDRAVLSDWSLFSARASASAGIELEHNVVIVLGEASGAASPLRIGHTVMNDAVDAASVRRMLREHFDVDPDSPELSQVLVNLLAKAEASPDGRVRGERHTMLNDSDINATRHARAAVGGVLACVVGHTALYVSGGAEHQGPPGGGPVAALVRVLGPVDGKGASRG
jgi:cyanuric acid amidohydrolase